MPAWAVPRAPTAGNRVACNRAAQRPRCAATAGSRPRSRCYTATTLARRQQSAAQPGAGRARARRTTRRKPRRSPQKKRGAGGERREEILAAAKALLLAEGYDGFSMRKVAAAVGISSTALYLYFKEKDELLDEICQRVFTSMAPELGALLADDASPIERLRKGLILYVHFGLAHPDEYRVVFLTRREGDAWDHRAPLQYVDRWGYPRINTFMFLVEGLRQCIAAGQVRDDDVWVMAESVLAAQHGLLALLILAPGQKWTDAATIVPAHVDMIVRGLAP